MDKDSQLNSTCKLKRFTIRRYETDLEIR